jgi:hypothetical protein
MLKRNCIWGYANKIRLKTTDLEATTEVSHITTEAE